MEWFRQVDLAEMRKELESENGLHLLSRISGIGGCWLPALDWGDWLDKWRACSSTEKDGLLYPIFAVYRECSCFEWWYVWILMFMEELFGLYYYFQFRIPDRDERWSVIAWSFLNALTYSKDNPDAELSLFGICEQVKRDVNKILRTERRRKRVERLMAKSISLTFRDEVTMRESGEDHFVVLCERMTCILNELSAMDKRIVEEICVFGHSQRICSLRLGMSRQQINRRLIHIRVEISRILKMPLVKKNHKQ